MLYHDKPGDTDGTEKEFDGAIFRVNRLSCDHKDDHLDDGTHSAEQQQECEFNRNRDQEQVLDDSKQNNILILRRCPERWKIAYDRVIRRDCRCDE